MSIGKLDKEKNMATPAPGGVTERTAVNNRSQDNELLEAGEEESKPEDIKGDSLKPGQKVGPEGSD